MPLGVEVGLDPSNIVLDGDPAPPPQKGQSHPIFGHVYCAQTDAWIMMPLGTDVGLGPGHVVLVCCGQTAGWIKMPLIMVGLGPGNIVLNADPAPPPRGTVLQISAHVCCGQTAGWIKMPLGMTVGLGPGNTVLDADPALPQGAQPPNLCPMYIVAKRLPISATAEHLFVTVK